MNLHRLFVYAACVGGLATLAAGPASAAVTVVAGNDLARACYQAALNPDSHLTAISTCTAALEGQPMSPSDRAATLVNRGILHDHNGDADAAIADYTASLKIDPVLAEAYADRGAVLANQKKYKAALADLNKGLALGTDRPQVTLCDRAYVREVLGNVRGAYLDYKKAAEVAPDYTLAVEQLRRFKVVYKPSTDT